MRHALIASLVFSVLIAAGAASCGARQCTPLNCATGCCTATGECASGGENAACGTAGNACVNCADSTQVCGNKACVALGTGGGGGSDPLCARIDAASTAFFGGNATCAGGGLSVTSNPNRLTQCNAGIAQCSSGDVTTLGTFAGCLEAAQICTAGNEAAAATAYFTCNGGVSGLTAPCSAALFTSSSGGGAGGGTGGGGGAFSCGRTPIECSDQAIQQLDLKSTVNPGTIANVADGVGFKSTIDATGGGFPPTDSYVYARFGASGLSKLPISDMTALDSEDWEIAFRRYVIRINSGDSGPSCVAAQVQPPGTTYEAVASVPGDYLPEGDDFLTRTPACAFVDDGSGLGSSPRTNLSGFYEYTGCVSMTGRVYLIRTQLGRHVKLIVTTYYATEAAQQTCQTTTTSGGALGGTIRVRWQYLD